MNTLVELIDLKDDLKTPEVHYYSVIIEGQSNSEFEKFLQSHSKNQEIKEEYNDLLAWLKDKLGTRGAQRRYFRHEKKAEALPPGSRFLEIDYDKQLRLYVIRISDHVVILLNGGIKTTKVAQKCPNVSKHFRLANQIAEKVDQAFKNNEIELGEDLRNLIFGENFRLIL